MLNFVNLYIVVIKLEKLKRYISNALSYHIGNGNISTMFPLAGQRCDH